MKPKKPEHDGYNSYLADFSFFLENLQSTSINFEIKDMEVYFEEVKSEKE